uniref:Uncharacterized protein n=1 Tax=uncultured marine virus TaxID=186617 RepID=A0A0F7L6V2_9VIRU|nr:hypothetical protein [uncultured marine virus]
MVWWTFWIRTHLSLISLVCGSRMSSWLAGRSCWIGSWLGSGRTITYCRTTYRS